MESRKLEYVVEPDSSRTDDFRISERLSDYLRPCIYCGQPADSIDHIPPRSMRAQLCAVELISVYEQEVSACRECNSALGASPLLTLTERRAYIRDWLRKRHKKLLRIPNWSEEKLKTLGDDLRKMIQRNMADRDYVKRRIAWSTQSGSVSNARNHFPQDENGNDSVSHHASGANGNLKIQGLNGEKMKRKCRWCKSPFETPHRWVDHCNECISIHAMRRDL